jgi:hypothetical protein
VSTRGPPARPHDRPPAAPDRGLAPGAGFRTGRPRVAFGFRRFAHYCIRACCSTPDDPTGIYSPQSNRVEFRRASKSCWHMAGPMSPRRGRRSRLEVSRNEDRTSGELASPTASCPSPACSSRCWSPCRSSTCRTAGACRNRPTRSSRRESEAGRRRGSRAAEPATVRSMPEVVVFASSRTSGSAQPAPYAADSAPNYWQRVPHQSCGIGVLS